MLILIRVLKEFCISTSTVFPKLCVSCFQSLILIKRGYKHDTVQFILFIIIIQYKNLILKQICGKLPIGGGSFSRVMLNQKVLTHQLLITGIPNLETKSLLLRYNYFWFLILFLFLTFVWYRVYIGLLNTMVAV